MEIIKSKKVEALTKKLEDAKRVREISKVRYDAHVLIVEGQRRTLAELENQNQQLLSELMDSNNAVGEFNTQLKEAINETHLKENEQARFEVKPEK